MVNKGKLSHINISDLKENKITPFQKKKKSTEVTFNKCMEKQIVVHLNNEMLSTVKRNELSSQKKIWPMF